MESQTSSDPSHRVYSIMKPRSPEVAGALLRQSGEGLRGIWTDPQKPSGLLTRESETDPQHPRICPQSLWLSVKPGGGGLGVVMETSLGRDAWATATCERSEIP